MPTPRRSTTNPTRTTSACGCVDRFRWKVFHRIACSLPPTKNQDGTVTEQEGHKQQDFATMILDNLRKAGVQNTRKAERLTFGPA